jgi:hypothetical protein
MPIAGDVGRTEGVNRVFEGPAGGIADVLAGCASRVPPCRSLAYDFPLRPPLTFR